MANANVITKSLLRHDRSPKIHTGPYAQALRLTGALAAGTTLGNNDSAFERVDVSEMSKIVVAFANDAGGTGSLSADIYPIAADGTVDDTVGTRLTAAAPTTVTTADVSSAAQDTIELDVSAFKYVDIELSTSNGGADTADLTFVDVFVY